MRPTGQHGCCLRWAWCHLAHCLSKVVFGWLLVAASGLLGQCGESPIHGKFPGFINSEVVVASQPSQKKH